MSNWGIYTRRTSSHPECDYDDTDIPLELDEVFSFGGLKYVLTGTYEGDTLDDAKLFLLTAFGRVEQDWSETDMISETGYVADGCEDSLSDRCYGVADAALAKWA